MGSKTLYLRTSGSTSSMGEPLILIKPRPALTKATATAVFYIGEAVHLVSKMILPKCILWWGGAQRTFLPKVWTLFLGAVAGAAEAMT
jgi:hypothetical protein